MNAMSVDEARARLDRLTTLHAAVLDEIATLRRQIARAEQPARRHRSKRETPPCGTETGYQRHHYRGEKCDACRLAHNAHNREQAANAKAAEVATRLGWVREVA